MRGDTFKTLLGIVCGLVFLGLVARGVDWGQVGDTIANSRPIYLLPIAVLLVFHYFSKAMRWRVLLSGHTDIGPIFAYRLTMIGFLMNNVFPARIGELGRPYLLSTNRPGITFPFALATVVGDKLFDLLLVIACLIVPASVLPLPDFARTGILVLAVVCLSIAGAAIAASFWHSKEKGRPVEQTSLYRLCSLLGRKGKPLYEAIGNFARGLSTVSSARRAFTALIFSLISFSLLAGVVYLTLLMVNLEGDVMTCLFVIGMIGIGFMIPAPPTSAGNFHFFAKEALVLAGVAAEAPALSFAIVAHISQVAIVTLVGVVSLIGLDWRKVREMGAQKR